MKKKNGYRTIFFKPIFFQRIKIAQFWPFFGQNFFSKKGLIPNMSIDFSVRYQKSRDFAEDLGILKIVKILVNFKKSFSIWSYVTYVASYRIYSGIIGNGRNSACVAFLSWIRKFKVPQNKKSDIKYSLIVRGGWVFLA